MGVSLYTNLFIGLLGFTLFALIGCRSGGQPHLKEYTPLGGDLVFRRGTGVKSMAVLQADSSGLYSHVGIVIETDSGFRVVHVTPGERKHNETTDRIKQESLTEFFAPDKAQTGAVMRWRGSSESPEAAAEEAKRLWRMGIEFDHDYNLKDSTEMYCTELVWHVYRRAGIDLSQGRRSEANVPLFSDRYIFPSDIYQHPHLELVTRF